MATFNFLVKPKALEVKVQPLSHIPSEVTLQWDFGVDKGVTTDTTYTYEESGFYIITAILTYSDGKVEQVIHPVIITDKAKTALSDSIYNLITNYIPNNLEELGDEYGFAMTDADKDYFIKKWQLYIGPLVNHDLPIPFEELNNEVFYEGLENQLVMELAVYDYLFIRIQNMLVQIAAQLENSNYLYKEASSTTSEDAIGNSQQIKQITTGPTEVQYYEQVTDSIASLLRAFSQATSDGGLLDQIRRNLCMLAARLEIIIPFCDSPMRIKVPRVVNKRFSGILGGPNPGFPVNKGVPSLLR